MQLKTCQSKQTQTFNTRWRKRCEYLSVKVKVETMRQHREIKRKPVLLTKANQNQVTNRHTNTRRDWGDRWFISDRGEHRTRPLPKTIRWQPNTWIQTHTLSNSEKHTQIDQIKRKREKRKRRKGGGQSEVALHWWWLAEETVSVLRFGHVLAWVRLTVRLWECYIEQRASGW